MSDWVAISSWFVPMMTSMGAPSGPALPIYIKWGLNSKMGFKWGLNFYITESGFETEWVGTPGTKGTGSKTHLESKCCAKFVGIEHKLRLTDPY